MISLLPLLLYISDQVYDIFFTNNNKYCIGYRHNVNLLIHILSIVSLSSSAIFLILPDFVVISKTLNQKLNYSSFYSSQNHIFMEYFIAINVFI